MCSPLSSEIPRKLVVWSFCRASSPSRLARLRGLFSVSVLGRAAARMMWNASDMPSGSGAKRKSAIGWELEDDRQTEHEEQRGCGAAYPDHPQSRREVASGEYRECVGREHPERRP